MIYRVLAVAFLICASPAWAGFDATPRREVNLSGRWRLNEALSQDAEALLAERLEQERRRYARDRQFDAQARPDGPPPLQADRPPPARDPRPWQKQRQENYRRMLGVTRTLEIQQQGTFMAVSSEMESRRLTAGSRTQVSMPEGELADSTVGWDGDMFVIDRKVRRGPRIVEKFRLLKSGQLEYLLAVSGDTELAGIKVRRVFDQSTAPAAAPNAELGPVR